MISDTQALSKDSPTDVDTNTSSYVRQYGDVDKSAFSVSGISLPASKKLLVSHLDTKDGSVRSTVRIEETAVDANLVPATAAVQVTFIRPSSTAITETIMLENAYRVIDFLIEGGAGANIVKLLNREV